MWFGVFLCAAFAAILPAGAASLGVPGLLSFDDSGRALVRSQDLPLRACVKKSLLPQSWEAPFKTVRLLLQSHHQQLELEPTLRQSLPLRAYCDWFEWVPGLSCDKCTERLPCHLDAAKIFGTTSRAGVLPPRGGCVYIEALSTRPKTEFHARAAWESLWDPFVFVQIAIGLALFLSAGTARESPAVHAAIGGVCALAVVIIVLFWWLLREARNLLPVPGASGIAFSLSLAALALFPGLSGLVGRGVPSTIDELFALINNARDPFYGAPIGWILVGAVALSTLTAASLGARYSVRFFAGPPETESEVEFVIGSDGRRIDMVPGIPWPQLLLGAALRLAGILTLLQSTHCDQCSVGVTIAALLGGWIWHSVGQLALAQPQDQHFCPILGEAAFEEQARKCTDTALQELRAYIRSDPQVVRRVSEDSELRLRRFSDGGRDFAGASATMELQVEQASSCALL